MKRLFLVVLLWGNGRRPAAHPSFFRLLLAAALRKSQWKIPMAANRISDKRISDALPNFRVHNKHKDAEGRQVGGVLFFKSVAVGLLCSLHFVFWFVGALFDSQKFQSLLQTETFGKHFMFFEEVDSTMNIASNEIQKGNSHESCVTDQSGFMICCRSSTTRHCHFSRTTNAGKRQEREDVGDK